MTTTWAIVARDSGVCTKSDSPDAFAASREDRASRGIEPFDGIWLPKIRNFEISFCDILNEIDHDTAKRTRA